MLKRCASVDIDFSENFTVPVKFEPQSLHCCHQQVTVHSGILKWNGEKNYIAHFSYDRKHDQLFVDNVVKNIIGNANLLIQSDNCSSQYKSARHFSHLQKLANSQQKQVLHLWSIAGHGKGEVDHVGGVAKIIIKRAISNDFFYENSSDMVQYLPDKFSNNLLYRFLQEVDVKAFEKERAEDSLKVYDTVDGSSTFQVAVFTPNSETFKAASRLCLCDSRLSKYGSCEMFKTYQLNCTQPKANFLQSQYQTELTEDTEVTSIGLIIPETFCAIATSSTSADTV